MRVEHPVDAVLEIVQRLGELVRPLVAEVAKRIGREDRVGDLPDLVRSGELDAAGAHRPRDLPQPLGGGRDIRRAAAGVSAAGCCDGAGRLSATSARVCAIVRAISRSSMRTS